MSELTSTTDAPPPAPPPPPDNGPTPNGSPELERALQDGGQSGADGGSPDAAASMAEAQEQAADAKTQLEHYRQNPTEVRTGSDVHPDVSPELAEALPQESDSVEVPAAASSGAATGADTPREGRPDIASEYPADYVPSADPPPSVEGPHESPEGWAADVNPNRDAPGRDNNCGECARAVESNWEGEPAAAAALSDPDSGGEPVARMTGWAGQAPTEASMSDVQQRLEELGPGSSAVVGCDWQAGGGHWFNAVNDGGTVKAIDGQSGETETWPPSPDGLGYSESDMRYSDAIFFTADGKVVRQ